MFEVPQSQRVLDKSPTPDSDVLMSRIKNLLERIVPQSLSESIDWVREEIVQYFVYPITAEQIVGTSFLEKRQWNVIIDVSWNILVIAMRYSQTIKNMYPHTIEALEYKIWSSILARKFLWYIKP